MCRPQVSSGTRCLKWIQLSGRGAERQGEEAVWMTTIIARPRTDKLMARGTLHRQAEAAFGTDDPDGLEELSAYISSSRPSAESLWIRENLGLRPEYPSGIFCDGPRE